MKKGGTDKFFGLVHPKPNDLRKAVVSRQVIKYTYYYLFHFKNLTFARRPPRPLRASSAIVWAPTLAKTNPRRGVQPAGAYPSHATQRDAM